MRVQFHSVMGICLSLILGAIASSAVAQTDGERLSGDEIREVVWGSQVQGSMAGGQNYSEIYMPDGEIIGDGYSGQATIVDDTMCFNYGDDELDCYGVSRDSDGRIEWIKDGEVVGYGDISEAP